MNLTLSSCERGEAIQLLDGSGYPELEGMVLLALGPCPGAPHQVWVRPAEGGPTLRLPAAIAVEPAREEDEDRDG